MFCSKCGKKILDGDVFCPGCGTKIEWARFAEPAPFVEENEQPEPEFPSIKETFDFNWDLDDFTRKKNEDVKIEWGDLLGTGEKKEAAEKKEDIIESPFADVDLNQRKALEPEPEQVKEEEPELEEGLEIFQREMKFDTFNRKNQEFQDLLDKERDRVRKNAEANAMMAEEIDSWAEKKDVELEEQETVDTLPDEIEIPDIIGEPEAVQEEITEPLEESIPEMDVIPETVEEEELVESEAEEEEAEPAGEEEITVEEAVSEEEQVKEPDVIPVAPVPEEKLSFFERRRRKKAQKQAMYDAPPASSETEEPLQMDENDIGGEWTEPEETAETPEVPEITITSVEEPEPEAKDEDVIENMLAVDAVVAPERKKSMTQKLSRDEFSDFLKNIEAQFGIEEPEAIQEDIAAAVAETEAAQEAFEEPEAIQEDIAVAVAEPEAVQEDIAAEVEETASEKEDTPEIIEEAEEVSEPAAEDVPVEAEPEPIAAEEAEPAAEEEPVIVEDISAIEPEKSVRKKEDTGEFKLGEFKDDSFWDDEHKAAGVPSESSKKGSGFGTFLIVLLALILLAEIAVLVIRFQFPDTAIAHAIEPVITQVEQWIRGLFT